MRQDNNITAPTMEEIKIMFSWGIINKDDVRWYVDNLAIDKEDYALITGEKY